MDIINNLIEEIGQTVFDNVPVDDWSKILLEASVLSTYVELTVTYYVEEKIGKSFDPNYENAPEEKEVDNLLIQLRNEMYKLSPGKGAWYNVEMIVAESGDFEIKYDYDNRPNFEMEPEDDEFVIDNEEFPRDAEATPAWLKEILNK
ncbi:immunity protein YezG family protein [Pedobacter sp. BMA]|uniref:immunity protein YezG family protein n=1 Tax=Pedobacter sp. BMA TaxID=1663685 RepID=UPI00069E56E9|nr:immunity protein YezG family protein [Pedobacter sp. BMA]